MNPFLLELPVGASPPFPELQGTCASSFGGGRTREAHATARTTDSKKQMCHKGFIKDRSVNRVKSSRKSRECDNEDKVGMAIRKSPQRTLSRQAVEARWQRGAGGPGGLSRGSGSKGVSPWWCGDTDEASYDLHLSLKLFNHDHLKPKWLLKFINYEHYLKTP